MVKIYDVKEWQELTWLNSGGTRAKRILQSDDESEWYFKCSERKPGYLLLTQGIFLSIIEGNSSEFPPISQVSCEAEL